MTKEEFIKIFNSHSSKNNIMKNNIYEALCIINKFTNKTVLYCDWGQIILCEIDDICHTMYEDAIIDLKNLGIEIEDNNYLIGYTLGG